MRGHIRFVIYERDWRNMWVKEGIVCLAKTWAVKTIARLAMFCSIRPNEIPGDVGILS